MCNLLHTVGVALEHALLVALSEDPASGSDLARRFDRSIGFFWHATHQQIYRTLARMAADGWLSMTEVAQAGSPARRVYDVSPAGSSELTRWLAAPTPVDPLRSELAVKLRAASRGDTAALRGIVEEHLADHTVRLDHYRQLQKRDYADPQALSGTTLDQYLVLRGGLLMEEFWVAWLTEWLDHQPAPQLDDQETP